MNPSLIKPFSYEFCKIDFESIYNETLDFFDEHFNGSVTVKSRLSHNNTTEICIDGLAFFIKKLFMLIFNQELFEIVASNVEGDMIFEISSYAAKEISREAMEELAFDATLYGFKVFFEDSKTVIRFFENPLNVVSLYAPGESRLKNAYLEAFI